MVLQGLNFAKIITTTQSDFDFFNSKYENTGIIVYLSNYKSFTPSDVPAILIGKKISSLIDFNDFNIVANIESINSTNQKEIEKQVSIVLERIAYDYIPFEYQNFDEIIDGDISKFLSIHLNISLEVFLFFQKKCLYLYSDGKLISISLESLVYCNGSFKEVIELILKSYNCFIFSYNNIKKYIDDDCISTDILTFENIVWCKEQSQFEISSFFRHFGNIEIFRNIPYLMSVYIKQNPLTEEELFSIKRFFKKDIITKWMSERTIAFNKSIEGLSLKKSKNFYYTSVEYSNKRTITGRINCYDDYFNIQTLPNNSEIRNNIISRYKNGKIVVFDYVSFEARIAIFSTGDLEFIDQFKNKDLHDFTSQIILQKENITPEERKYGKLFNHTLLYGGGNEKLKSIVKSVKDLNDDEFDLIYDELIFKLSPIIQLSESIIQNQKDDGYIINPYGSLIKPRKDYAAFNNFIQSTAADIVIEKLFEVKKFTQNKNINFLYQVYDSFIFDFDESELNSIPELISILESANKVKFLVNYKTGNTLMNCSVPEYEELEIMK